MRSYEHELQTGYSLRSYFMKIFRYYLNDILRNLRSYNYSYVVVAVLIALSAMTGLQARADVIEFRGLTLPAITVTPDKSTGLEAVYVLPTVSGVEAVYTAASPTAAVTWSRYSNLGGGYAEEVSGVAHSGTEWTLSRLDSDMGYIIDEGTKRYCFWVVDMEEHPLDLTSLTISPEQECDVTALDLIGSADRITYYTVNGRSVDLDRGLTLSYTTMEYDDAAEDYRETRAEVSLAYVNALIHVPAPLCDTHFTLSGDRFATLWGEPQSAESPLFNTSAVEAHCTAKQIERDASNEQTEGSTADVLGGSAPAEITFTAAVTDAAVFHEWQMAGDDQFENINSRFSETELTYTFTEMGTTYMRFVAADASGNCEYYGPVYTIQIGESRLECPNAFSPDASEGINDEWKVSYKSIVSFECHIFNRYGQLMKHFNDPSQGWDGKYNGKFVPAGVYYYVIKARGSDGKKYDLSGDINIVKYN